MFLVRLGVLDYSHRFTDMTYILALSGRLGLAHFMVISLHHSARFGLFNPGLLRKKEE